LFDLKQDILYNVLYITVLYSTMQFYKVLQYTIQYNTI